MTNSSTRISRSEVVDLCETIHASGPLPVFGARALGLFLCVRLTLIYLRHNPCQELLAEAYCVSQATVSRIISAYTPLIAQALQASVPTVEDLDPTAQLIIDGTLLECWSWADHPELDLRQAQDHGAERPGGLHPVRDPGLGIRPPGRMHARRSGPAPQWPARRPRHRPARRDATTQAYWRQGVHRTGNDHPEKKTPALSLHPDDRTYNKTVNQVRYKSERVIANIKTWRVLHTGHRRPLDTFPETITAVLELIFTYTP